MTHEYRRFHKGERVRGHDNRTGIIHSVEIYDNVGPADETGEPIVTEMYLVVIDEDHRNRSGLHSGGGQLHSACGWWYTHKELCSLEDLSNTGVSDDA